MSGKTAKLIRRQMARLREEGNQDPRLERKLKEQWTLTPAPERVALAARCGRVREYHQPERPLGVIEKRTLRAIGFPRWKR